MARRGELVTVERFAGRWCIVARVRGTRGGGRVLVGGPRRCEVLRAGIHLVDLGRVC